MPTVDSRLDVPKCKVPACPNTCAIKEVTIYGRVRHRNVCDWHHKHPDNLDPPSMTKSGHPNPYAPRTCAFPKCKRDAVSLGIRKGGRFYAKWCGRHRLQWMRDYELSQNPDLAKQLDKTIHDIPNPPPVRPQARTAPHRPHAYPKEEYVKSQPSNPRKLQKIATWKHGPQPEVGRAIIDKKFPGGRVVYNDDGYATWATFAQIRALDAAVMEGMQPLEDLMRLMERHGPKVFHPEKSVWQGDTFPRITTGLTTLLLRWVSDSSKRIKMSLPELSISDPTTLVSGRTAEEEAKRLFRQLKKASKPIRRRVDSF